MSSSVTASPEKLTATKVLNLPPTLMGRLNRVAATRSESANEIVRRALVAELDRLEQQATIESQRMDRLRKLASTQGIDVDALLEKLLAEKTAPALPGMADLASEKLPLAATGTEG